MSEPASAPNPAAPPVVPYLTVDDGLGALAFYERAFGAQLMFKQLAPDQKKVVHAAFLINGGQVLLSDDFPEMSGGKESSPKAFGGSPVMVHLNVPDVDAAFAQAVAAGATVTMPLADMFWGDRYGTLVDPFGHKWSLATKKKQPTHEEIDAATKKAFEK